MQPAFVTMWEMLGSPIPMPDELKHEAIRHYARKSGARALVETGTYMGGTPLALHNYFDDIVTIEASLEVYDKFRDKVPVLPDNVTAMLGKSYELLPGILRARDGPRVFWLDAHGSTWGHEFGGPSVDVPESSVLEELEIIFANKHEGDVVLIDDADIFGTYGWMPLEEVVEFINEAGYSCRLEALILACEL